MLDGGECDGGKEGGGEGVLIMMPARFKADLNAVEYYLWGCLLFRTKLATRPEVSDPKEPMHTHVYACGCVCVYMCQHSLGI